MPTLGLGEDVPQLPFLCGIQNETFLGITLKELLLLLQTAAVLHSAFTVLDNK